jgi:hypothetical protein
VIGGNKTTMSAHKADFQRLLQEGRIALDNGDRNLAHALWREAAMLNPYNEQVWLALLDVLESLEDRQVCLQNIVEINPLNVQARRMLRAYEARETRRDEVLQARQQQQRTRQRRRRTLIWRALLLGVFVGLSGLFFATVLSILIYAV